jgi:hypothetical protein
MLRLTLAKLLVKLTTKRRAVKVWSLYICRYSEGFGLVLREFAGSSPSSPKKGQSTAKPHLLGGDDLDCVELLG